MTPVLKAEKLSKWYGNILGISDINLEIGSGITGLLGPNGAGKSTFLKIAAGQLKPKIGALTVFGEAVYGNPLLFRRIGFCPEHDSAYAEMSGGRFILLLARLHGFAGAEAAAKTEKALATVGLLDSQDRAIKGYSFGMRQRLRLASSILHEPELLMLDEPLRGVDPVWRIRIMQLIKDYGKQGRTVIVSSHILPEIEAMTNEIVLIHQGKIFAKGDIHRIRGLIDSHPHQVSIRTPHPRRIAARLIDSDFVSGIEFAADGRSLTVKHQPARPVLHRPDGPARRERRGDRRDHLPRRQPAGGLRLPDREMTMKTTNPIPILFGSFFRAGLKAKRTRVFILLAMVPVLLMLAARVMESLGSVSAGDTANFFVQHHALPVLPAAHPGAGPVLRHQHRQRRAGQQDPGLPDHRAGAAPRRAAGKVPGRLPARRPAGRRRLPALLPGRRAHPPGRQPPPGKNWGSFSAPRCWPCSATAPCSPPLGAFMKKSILLGLFFVFGWESVVQYFPGVTQKFTIIHWVKSLLPIPPGQDGFLIFQLQPSPALESVIVLLAAGILFLLPGRLHLRAQGIYSI